MITHTLSALGGIIAGWFLGTTLDVFRRPLARLIGDSPLGRNPEMNVVVVEDTINDGADYSLTIANTGDESAEDVSLFLSFEKEIIEFNIVPYGNEAPHSDIDVELRQDGGVDIRVDQLLRSSGKTAAIIIEFTLGENESSTSTRIEEVNSRRKEEIVAYLNPRVSWTFLGEERYDDPDGRYLSPVQNLP
ncbi:hypothetical protein [Natrarchaeobaculum sulfurireducens]|uniref:hypothetical protein n=1 Tax=Natrarchaeobaculum sulfurireducens TaxID=2044521 RepID=UPI00105AB05E|nr:hypothetical protein [Natrarchaeobaculum sulfurireducens]